MNMKRESVIASVSARLLGGGAGGVPGALTELASFLGVKSGALLEMDGDGTPAREFLLAGGEVKEQSPPVFSSVRPEGLRELTRKLWEKNALLIDPEDAQESFGSMIFGAAGFREALHISGWFTRAGIKMLFYSFKRPVRPCQTPITTWSPCFAPCAGVLCSGRAGWRQ